MQTIEQLRADIERDLSENQQQLDDYRAMIEAVVSHAENTGRASLTAEEDVRCQALYKDVERLRAANRRISAKLTRAREIEDETSQQEKRLGTVRKNTLPTPNARTATLTVTQNARTYHRGNDPTGQNFVADVARAQVTGDPKAWSRLARHMDEEERERGSQYVERAPGDATTTTAGGIVVPQYLVDMTAPAVAARRPFADACTKHVLPPDGMSFIIPTITTATSAAIQTTELTSVSATSVGETNLTLAVKTAAGMQNVSRQAVERSRLDDFVLSDLMARYATVLDNELINGATTGLDAVATGAATAGLTAAQIYSAILGRQSAVEAALLGGKADMVVMHSRRWAFLSAQVTSSWPFINSDGVPVQAAGTANNQGYGSSVRGLLPNGMSAVIDNNVVTNKGAGTNEDPLYVVPSLECHLWEAPGAPVMIRAEQPNAANLGLLIVVYGFFAYTFSRYSSAMGKVSGLTAPVF